MKKTAGIMKYMLLFITIMTFILLNSSNIYANDGKFAGQRQVILSIDKSDMENFISGGRTNFEYILRSNKPEWCNYSINSSDLEVLIEISFLFDNYEDYLEKLTEIISFNPSIIYENNTELKYMEGFRAYDFINFVKDKLNMENSFDEMTKADLFRVEKNIIILNDTEYSGEEKISIKSTESAMKFTKVNLETSINDDLTYTRVISLYYTNKRSELEEQLRYVNGQIEISDTSAKITINASEAEELVELTMKVLNTSDIITQDLSYINETSMGMAFTENIDIEDILEENGSYSYNLTCPVTFKNIKKIDSSNIEITGQMINTTSTSGIVRFKCDRPFAFSNITLTTDLSSIFGKVTKMIELKLPIGLSKYYHESIKEQLSNKLVEGTELTIYDKAGYRIYEIKYQSRFDDDINYFLKKLTQKEQNYEMKESGFYIFRSRINENITASALVNDLDTSGKITVKYITNPLTSVKNDDKKLTTEDEHTYVMKVNDGEHVELKYNTIRFVNIVIFIIFVTIIAVLTKKYNKELRQFVNKTTGKNNTLSDEQSSEGETAGENNPDNSEGEATEGSADNSEGEATEEGNTEHPESGATEEGNTEHPESGATEEENTDNSESGATEEGNTEHPESGATEEENTDNSESGATEERNTEHPESGATEEGNADNSESGATEEGSIEHPESEATEEESTDNPEEKTPVFCDGCGVPLEKDARFCVKCGKKI